jgi:hypothetical protein
MTFKALVFLSLLASTTAIGQVTVSPNLNLELAERDSVTSAKIETSLNAFLTEAQDKSYRTNTSTPHT